MKSHRALVAMLVAFTVAVATAGVVVAVVLTRDDDPTAEKPPTSGETYPLKAQLMIYPNDLFETIPGSTWNRCDGEPECEGEECHGVGETDGLGTGTQVHILDADGKSVALGQVDSSWGWKKGRTQGACVLYWSAKVPTSETGVLTVRLDKDSRWSNDFTLEQLREAPHKLDFMSIGDMDD